MIYMIVNAVYYRVRPAVRQTVESSLLKFLSSIIILSLLCLFLLSRKHEGNVTPAEFRLIGDQNLLISQQPR